MLYETVKFCKYGGKIIRPGKIITIEDKDDIKTLKQAKAIVNTDKKIETAMRAGYETREDAFKQPIETHLNSKGNGKIRKKRGRKKKQ